MSTKEQTQHEETSLVDQLRTDELECIISEVENGRRANLLKQLDERGRAQELIQQQYSGRYPFELLQNANDAAVDAGRPGRVRFVLTDRAVIAADNGAGFQDEQIRAICGLGRSSKDPTKSVGYKGLGFKSVGEITDRPQILSNGVAFEFDEERVRGTVAEATGPLPGQQRLPIYAFPFPVGDFSDEDGRVIRAAHDDGLTTALRLPLRKDLPRAQVEHQLQGSLLPRLLLFLRGVEELELAGTSSDFKAVVTRESHDLHEEVLLETNGSIEHWLMYRHWIEVEPELVTPLGDAWAEVERVHVAVAVPLDEEGIPRSDTLFPLHVYFPTEEKTGLPVVVNGDFALQLDRRQLATSPEASPYNESLVQSAAEFLANVVAPDLAGRFRGTAAGAVAVAPRASPTGVAEQFIRWCTEALVGSRFLPAVDGELKLPAEGLLLPEKTPDPQVAHRHLDLRAHGRVLVAPVEADPTVRSFLTDALSTDELPLAEALSALQEPTSDGLEAYYEFLVDWSEGVGGRLFASHLAEIECVRTANGEWVAPGDRVFFPRQREDVEIPEDLPVPIADVPTVEGLHSLLGEAGVRDFEWRELIRDYLLPILTSAETEDLLRDRAMKGLRAYYESQRAGDPVLRRRIGEILMPATRAEVTTSELRPANKIYFGEQWTGSNALEALYGPFGEPEFLALHPPADPEERATETKFLEWVGVAAHPRLLEARGEQRDIYLTGNLLRHPHRFLGEHWDQWWEDPRVREASHCSQGHSNSQQLRSSFALDRFVELCEERDPRRILILWNELANRWGADYERGRKAVFHCQHSSHGGERDRAAPSLFWHLLTEAPWIPVLLNDDIDFVRPRDAWRMALDTPRWIVKRVPIVDPTMLEAAGLNLAATLDVTDAARPEPEDLVHLLRDLQTEHQASDETAAGIQVAARWTMRTLNDALAAHPEVELDAVPLLATYKGEQVFTTDPVVAVDPLLAEIWQNYYAVLDADRDLGRLHEALDLAVLDDPETGVEITPVPRGVNERTQDRVEAALVHAKPYLAALAAANTPSRGREVVRGLSRLEVVTCSKLTLRYSFRGKTIEYPDATTFIAVRREKVGGAVRRNIGTAHLELASPDASPDWYTFGPQLAAFLQVPTLGDGYGVLLSGDDEDRRRYLASRRIPPSAVEEMRVELDLPPEDELPEEVIGFLEDVEKGFMAATQEPESAAAIEDDGDESVFPEEPEAEDEQEPLPNLDVSGMTITDVDPGEIGPESPDGRGGGGGLGPPGPVDHEEFDRRTRAVGRRGEEAAFDKEKERVQGFGGDPTAVIWRSKHHPFAPYDIESLDEDGQRIYIEVKATSASDPRAPFPISREELMHALRLRGRHYIYRVTNVYSASPDISRYRDPARLLAEGRADINLRDATMAFGTSS